MPFLYSVYFMWLSEFHYYNKCKSLREKENPKIRIKNIAVNWDPFPSPSTDTEVR